MSHANHGLAPGVTRRASLAAIPLALALAACGRTPAPPRKVRLVVGAAAGGGSDAFTRLLAQHLQRLGHVSLVLENDERGGGRVAADSLAKSAPDGSVIAFLPPSLIYADLLGREHGPKLDQFAWLGGIGADRRVLVVNGQSGVVEFSALKTRAKPLILAASTANTPNFIEPLIVRRLTGARLKPVAGYKGGARNLAVLSGEVDGLVGGIDSVGHILDAPGAKVLLRLNERPLAQGPQPPTLASLAQGADAAALLDVIETCAKIGRLFAAPPGTPPAILEHWRALLSAVVADPAFRTEALKQGYDLEFTPGDEVKDDIVRLTAANSPARSALAPLAAEAD